MVVFGIYEPLVRWLADIRKKFYAQPALFLPVGIGGVIGVIAFSAVIDFAFDNFAAQFTWLFIGFISGTIPSLLKTAREQGRKNWHWLLLAVFAVGIYFFMTWMKTIRSVTMEPSFWGWVLSGR
jgi:putative membrane protein